MCLQRQRMKKPIDDEATFEGYTNNASNKLSFALTLQGIIQHSMPLYAILQHLIAQTH